MKFLRIFLLLVLFAGPAAAFNPEADLLEDAIGGCGGPSPEAPVRVPRLWREPGHKEDLETGAALRWRLWRVRHEMNRLWALLDSPARRLPYSECRGAFDAMEKIASAADQAAGQEAKSYVAGDIKDWSLSWSEWPMSRLQAEASKVRLSTGAFAAVCQPVEMDSSDERSSYIPIAPSSATMEEKETYKQLADEAVQLRNVIATETIAFRSLLEVLEGRDCRKMNESFIQLIQAQRGAYVEYQRQMLGRMMARQLNWKKVGA